MVVEAAARSGSLITARLALELGREVLAVPGRITDEQALGVNDLLRDGAGPVTHPADILERLGLPPGAARDARPAAAARPAAEPPSGAGRPARGARSGARPRRSTSLAASAEVDIDVAVAALLELELAGWAIRAPGGRLPPGVPLTPVVTSAPSKSCREASRADRPKSVFAGIPAGIAGIDRLRKPLQHPARNFRRAASVLGLPWPKT